MIDWDTGGLKQQRAESQPTTPQAIMRYWRDHFAVKKAAEAVTADICALLVKDGV
jgi:hypothetical protein